MVDKENMKRKNIRQTIINEQGMMLPVIVLLVVVLVIVAVVIVKLGIFNSSFPTLVNNTPSQSSTAEGAALPDGYVEITSSGFIPKAINIKAGQRVRFVNTDSSNHQLVAVDRGTTGTWGNLLSTIESLGKGQSVAIPFNQKGNYVYTDAFNSKLKGTVVVN